MLQDPEVHEATPQHCRNVGPARDADGFLEVVPRLARRERPRAQEEPQVPEEGAQGNPRASLEHPQIQLPQEHVTERRRGRGAPGREAPDRLLDDGDPRVHFAGQGERRPVGEVDAEQEGEPVALDDLPPDLTQDLHALARPAHERQRGALGRQRGEAVGRAR